MCEIDRIALSPSDVVREIARWKGWGEEAFGGRVALDFFRPSPRPSPKGRGGKTNALAMTRTARIAKPQAAMRR